MRVEILNRFTLNGTIDGHDPLGVTFRIHGPQGAFRLTVISVNWGRGYTIAQFHANVLRVLDRVDEMDYVVILMQEIDEADPAPEHPYIRGQMEPGTTLVQWGTREPIAVSPGVKVTRKRKVMTMDQGSAIGAPKDTGPRRFLTSCVVTISGVKIWVGNQHPHRVPKQAPMAGQKVVVKARVHGETVTRDEVKRGLRVANLAVYGGDMNDAHYPAAHKGERVAYSRDLDTIRYVTQ